MKKIFLIAAIAVAGVAAWAASNTNVFSSEDANAGCAEYNNGRATQKCSGIFKECTIGRDGITIICHGHRV